MCSKVKKYIENTISTIILEPPLCIISANNKEDIITNNKFFL